jgi:hypothetical protein
VNRPDTVFIDYEMLTACQSPHCLQPLSYLQNSTNPLYAGVDLGLPAGPSTGRKFGGQAWQMTSNPQGNVCSNLLLLS